MNSPVIIRVRFEGETRSPSCWAKAPPEKKSEKKEGPIPKVQVFEICVKEENFTSNPSFYDLKQEHVLALETLLKYLQDVIDKRYLKQQQPGSPMLFRSRTSTSAGVRSRATTPNASLPSAHMLGPSNSKLLFHSKTSSIEEPEEQSYGALPARGQSAASGLFSMNTQALWQVAGGSVSSDSPGPNLEPLRAFSPPPYSGGTLQLYGHAGKVSAFARVLENLDQLRKTVFENEQNAKRFKTKVARMEHNPNFELSGKNVGEAWEELGILYSKMVSASMWLEYLGGIVSGLVNDNKSNPAYLSSTNLHNIETELGAIQFSITKYKSALEFLMNRLKEVQERTSGELDPILSLHAGEKEEIRQNIADIIGDFNFVKALDTVCDTTSNVFSRINETSYEMSKGELKGAVAILQRQIPYFSNFRSKLIVLKRKYEFESRKAVNLGTAENSCPFCLSTRSQSQSHQVSQPNDFSEAPFQQITPFQVSKNDSGNVGPKPSSKMSLLSTSLKATAKFVDSTDSGRKKNHIVYQQNSTAASHFPQLQVGSTARKL